MIKRICWFCREEEGEDTVATQFYYATKAKQFYDVCDRHAEWIKKVSPDTKLLPIIEE
jgi:hypothetical protein